MKTNYRINTLERLAASVDRLGLAEATEFFPNILAEAVSKYGADSVAGYFGVSSMTVRRWVNEGAATLNYFERVGYLYGLSNIDASFKMWPAVNKR